MEEAELANRAKEAEFDAKGYDKEIGRNVNEVMASSSSTRSLKEADLLTTDDPMKSYFEYVRSARQEVEDLKVSDPQLYLQIQEIRMQKKLEIIEMEEAELANRAKEAEFDFENK